MVARSVAEALRPVAHARPAVQNAGNPLARAPPRNMSACVTPISQGR